MPRFMDVHDGFIGVTQAQLDDAHRRDVENQVTEGVTFDQAWLDPNSGKVFCLSTGPDRNAVMRVHERSGHPTDQVYELLHEVA